MILTSKNMGRVSVAHTPSVVRVLSPKPGAVEAKTQRPTLTVLPAKAQMAMTRKIIDYLRTLGLTIGEPKDTTLFEGSTQHTARVTNVPRRISPEDRLGAMHKGVGYRQQDYQASVKEDRQKPSLTLTRQTQPKRSADPASIHLDAEKECLTLMY